VIRAAPARNLSEAAHHFGMELSNPGYPGLLCLVWAEGALAPSVTFLTLPLLRVAVQPFGLASFQCLSAAEPGLLAVPCQPPVREALGP
jgi:hypothetical protein